ncbi:hypothetical protein Ae201684P_022422 [Aphanomyces euteiches]|uniref:Uncharacterized protein n=1 Tax=Aphanomyces euteiches TaxID=100861 RepID=A0A6G0X6W0_9STRA|nr:hypothetical protein Ae201684_007975 [Aphanomyces euteiches]KAH9074620.1 hypothetical protein Ae201684P_022422 [Aphanomyces euteiches]
MLRDSNYASCSNIALHWSKTVRVASNNSSNAPVEVEKSLDGFKMPPVRNSEKTIHSSDDEEDVENTQAQSSHSEGSRLSQWGQLLSMTNLINVRK